MKIIAVTILLYLTNNVLAYCQTVKEVFSEEVLVDNFESDKGIWPNVNNADNLFVIQKGEYIINRKNLSSPYNIIADWENNLSAFKINTSVKIDQGISTESAVGVIFMAQLTGKGAFVVEINKFKQYRIKQLVGSSFKYLTGDLKSEGWAKSADLKGAGEYNHIEIRAANKQYDVLINNNFILSFTEYTYRSGRMGLTAGPGTIARALNFFVYTTPLVASELKDTISTTDETSANKKADTLEVLNNEIKALKAEIRILQQQRSKNTTSRDTGTELKSLEEEINRVKKEKEMLQRENKVLREQLEK